MTAVVPDIAIRLKGLVNERVEVGFVGGRVVRGMLKGFDHQNSLVLSNSVELVRDLADPYSYSGEERKLGLVVVKSTLIHSILPSEPLKEIPNPFINN